jgi:hypothetical protein
VVALAARRELLTAAAAAAEVVVSQNTSRSQQALHTHMQSARLDRLAHLLVLVALVETLPSQLARQLSLQMVVLVDS